MTLIRFNNRPVEKSFNKLVDDFFYGFPSILTNDALSQTQKSNVPVNIRETEGSYVLEVVAPGFGKDDFKVDLDKSLLTISAQHKTEEEKKEEKQIRKEYRFQSFKRSFNLDEAKVDAAHIDAKYNNGILTLNLPKKEEVKEPVKQISIQ